MQSLFSTLEKLEADKARSNDYLTSLQNATRAICGLRRSSLRSSSREPSGGGRGSSGSSKATPRNITRLLVDDSGQGDPIFTSEQHDAPPLLDPRLLSDDAADNGGSLLDVPISARKRKSGPSSGSRRPSLAGMASSPRAGSRASSRGGGSQGGGSRAGSRASFREPSTARSGGGGSSDEEPGDLPEEGGGGRSGGRRPSKSGAGGRRRSSVGGLGDDGLGPEDEDEREAVENFIGDLFAEYAGSKDNKGRPLMNGAALRAFFRDFVKCDAETSIVRADLKYAEEIERQADVNWVYGLSKSEAGRGLCLKSFAALLKDVLPSGMAHSTARGHFHKYSGSARAMRMHLSGSVQGGA